MHKSICKVKLHVQHTIISTHGSNQISFSPKATPPKGKQSAVQELIFSFYRGADVC